MYMYKIGVVGDRDSILGFKALGLSVFPVTQPEQASRLINRLAKENFAVIFLTRQVAREIKESGQVQERSLPAIILIPAIRAVQDWEYRRSKKCGKGFRADILFGNE